MPRSFGVVFLVALMFWALLGLFAGRALGNHVECGAVQRVADPVSYVVKMRERNALGFSATRAARFEPAGWCFRCYGMKTPGRAKTVLSAVVSPSPSAPPS
jgi:hypothetical protein